MEQSAPIDKVIEHYGGRLRNQYDGWQKIKCPFHDDGHASAGLSLGQNLFVCHGCGVKGNAFNVIKVYEGVTYREAIKIAEGITGASYQLVRNKPAIGRRVSQSTGIRSRNSGGNTLRRSR